MYDCPSTNSSRSSRPMGALSAPPRGAMSSGGFLGGLGDPSSMIALLIIAGSFFKK